MRESSQFLDSGSIADAKHRPTPCEIISHDCDAQLTSKTSIDHPLYQRSRVLAWLENQVPDHRLKHILRVEEMAIALAKHHQLDVEKAAQAGLMHDLAKFFNPKRLLQMAQDNGIEMDEVFEATPHLLHADVSAIVAQDEFGIRDPDVLDAIRNHTLGRPGMSPLSCVVFLADSLEPGRGDSAELQELRKLCWNNLYEAVGQTSEYTLKFLLDSPCLVHPRAVLTRNWAVQMVHCCFVKKGNHT